MEIRFGPPDPLELLDAAPEAEPSEEVVEEALIEDMPEALVVTEEQLPIGAVVEDDEEPEEPESRGVPSQVSAPEIVEVTVLPAGPESANVVPETPPTGQAAPPTVSSELNIEPVVEALPQEVVVEPPVTAEPIDIYPTDQLPTSEMPAAKPRAERWHEDGRRTFDPDSLPETPIYSEVASELGEPSTPTAGGEGGGDQGPPSPGSIPGEYDEGEERGEEDAETSAETKGVVPPPAEFIVERRQVGDVTVTAVLYNQTPDDGAEIAAELEDCDVIAIGAVEAFDARRRCEEEAMYTDALSSQADPRLLADMAERAGPGNISETLMHLRGTDKQVALLGVDLDTREYQEIPAFERTIDEYNRSVEELRPVSEALLHASASVEAAVKVETAMDGVIARQVATAVHEAASQKFGAKVGVVLGQEHYRVIEATGVPAQPQPGQLTERVNSDAPLFFRAMEATRNGDPIAAGDLMQRHALSRYIAGYSDRYPDVRQAEAYVAEIPDLRVGLALALIGNELSTVPEQTYEARAQRVRDAMPEILQNFLDRRS